TPITGGLLGSEMDNSFDISSSKFEQLSDIAQNKYGYKPGSFKGDLDEEQDNNKFLAKLDWNINQDHKLTFRYNHVAATDGQGVYRGRGSYCISIRKCYYNSMQNSFVAEIHRRYRIKASIAF